jgi:hypothetical protein
MLLENKLISCCKCSLLLITDKRRAPSRCPCMHASSITAQLVIHVCFATVKCFETLIGHTYGLDWIIQRGYNDDLLIVL